jgi:mono/diheme cytochrome c family protein
MRGDRTQILLIISGVVATSLFGWFLYKELFPEYKIYQNAYVELEEFRSTYTGQPAPAFRTGVKQIVIERKDLGPPVIDRCTSCHVALQFQHFSPTQIARDVNGQIVFDEQGLPKKEPNPTYVWAKLDEKINDLTDPVQNEKLSASIVNQRLAEAERLKALKTVKVGEHEWNMAKVLQMHPLMGTETRPFEFHSIDDYGCVSCHGGNGRGLTTMNAHGPVFDEQYEEEDMGPEPIFLEHDEENDPRFSKVFNAKPGHELLFQTTPILVGDLMEAKCIQCHQSSASIQQESIKGKGDYTKALKKRSNSINQSYDYELNALISLIQLKLKVKNLGVAETVKQLRDNADDYTLLESERKKLASQAELLNLFVGGSDGLRKENAQPALDVVVQKLDERIVTALGSKELADQLNALIDPEGVDVGQIVDQFIHDHDDDLTATGAIFKKVRVLSDNTHPLTEVDLLTKNFHSGESLYINQGCYACHRITGFARGGVGPELTEIGNYYPWYIKESIVWPQADLKTSTMPNYKLDHNELEDLVTFLLAQKGPSKIISPSDYKQAVMDWDSGKRLPWEMPSTPAQMHDVNYGLTIFATEGCAACHRLKGFTSDVGFSVEKNNPDFDALYNARQWFSQTIPEDVSGSDIVHILETKSDEIDQYIVNKILIDPIL